MAVLYAEVSKGHRKYKVRIFLALMRYFYCSDILIKAKNQLAIRQFKSQIIFY